MTYTGALTDAQLAALHAERDKWMTTGLSTERCDRAKSEAAVRRAYRTAGLDEPQIVVWMDSPLGGAFAAAAIKALTRGQLRGQLGDQLGGQLWGQLGGQLDPWYEAYWLALYSHALVIADLPIPDRLGAIYEAIAETGWWWPMRGAVVLTDRPTQIHRDPQARLHNDDGPALAYADGHTLHSWHGVTVPADLIEGGWSTERVLKEPNSEIRRCAVEVAAERDGWQQMIATAGWKQVGSSVADPGNPGQVLSLWDIGDLYGQGERLHLLHMVNGTVERDGSRHEFGETVPDSITDPVAAAAWQIGISPSDYATTARRT